MGELGETRGKGKKNCSGEVPEKQLGARGPVPGTVVTAGRMGEGGLCLGKSRRSGDRAQCLLSELG